MPSHTTISTQTYWKSIFCRVSLPAIFGRSRAFFTVPSLKPRVALSRHKTTASVAPISPPVPYEPAVPFRNSSTTLIGLVFVLYIFFLQDDVFKVFHSFISLYSTVCLCFCVAWRYYDETVVSYPRRLGRWYFYPSGKSLAMGGVGTSKRFLSSYVEKVLSWRVTMR